MRGLTVEGIAHVEQVANALQRIFHLQQGPVCGRTAVGGTPLQAWIQVEDLATSVQVLAVFGPQDRPAASGHDSDRSLRQLIDDRGFEVAKNDYGYSVIPSQSDKDEQGNLLDNPFDPRCTEWLVEIPVAVSWADLPGADKIDVSKFSVLAQLDFVMQVSEVLYYP